MTRFTYLQKSFSDLCPDTSLTTRSGTPIIRLLVMYDFSRLKAICRLWFHGEKKYISVFNDEKKEEKIEINSIEDIYKYSDKLVATLSRYESKHNNNYMKKITIITAIAAILIL